MRDRFELNCKTIGLVFFCIGAYYALTTIPLFFHKGPDVTKMLPRSTLEVMGPSRLAELKDAASYTWKYTLRTLFFCGLVPMATSLYLMRSDNLFVRRCYPEGGGKRSLSFSRAKDKAEPDTKPDTPKRADDERPNTEYAPPGYFD